MATNLENVPILDNADTERKIVGQEFDQSGTTLFAQGVIPFQTIIQDDTVALSTSNVDTAISGLANLVMVDLGSNNPTGLIRIQGQFRGSGDFMRINHWFGGHAPEFPLRRRWLSQSNWTYVDLTDTWQGVDDGSRIIYIPAAGLETLRLVLSTGSLADVRVVQICTPAMPPTPAKPTTQAYALGSFDLANTTYTTGDAIDAVANMVASSFGPVWTDAVARLLTLSAADYAGDLDECDIVIAAPGSNSDQTDDAAFDFDYPEAIIAWLEIRDSPTGDQIQMRDFGASGGKGFNAVLDLPIPYMNVIATDDLHVFDIFAIDRSGITSTGATVYMEAQVEL